jgi:hypothetical protein
MLKSHHPCFWIFFDFCSVCGGFLLLGGPFCLFRSGDIFFAPLGGFLVLPPDDIGHNSMHVLSSNFCRCKTENRTIDIESESIAMPGIPPALQTAGRHSKMDLLFGASGCLR